MLFTSLTFFLFLAIVLLGYALLRHRAQNLWLLAASYTFYGFWSWKFALLLLGCTAVNHYCGWRIHGAADDRGRRRWLWISIAFSLGCLGFFKYYNFFADNLEDLAGVFGLEVSWHMRDLVLPIGISFYTFQALSYTIDIHRRKLEPVRSFLDFALFVSFFPQLVAGPIERATHLLPQILKPRTMTLDGFLSGCWLILLGVYKKIFVADQLGRFVNTLMVTTPDPVGGDVALGLVLFSLQVYADFAGYTDVARGAGRLMGFELVQNFRAPYFARNIQEFWNRWHVSLTSWIKDYLFYPMAVSRRWNRILGPGGMSIVIMVVIGFWHGPSWNFVLWGLFHGLLIHLYMKMRPFLYRHFTFEHAVGKRLWFVCCVVFTFSAMTFGEILFFCEDLAQVGPLVGALFTGPLVGDQTLAILETSLVIWCVPFLLDVDEYLHQEKGAPLTTWHGVLRFAVQAALLVSLAQVFLSSKVWQAEPYLYFQF